MSAYRCDQVREAAPELALGVLAGAERAEVLIHLGHCPSCQAYVAELTEAADAVPLVAPEWEPPAGYEDRVLARLDVGRDRHRRRWFASMAVAAAAAAILSITIVRVVDAGSPPTVTSAPSNTPAVMQARMVSDVSGDPVGWAYVSGGRAVALNVSYGLEGGDYDIQVRPTRGASVDIGDMTYEGARGSWAGTSPVEIAPRSDIALVQKPSGHTVCHGKVAVVD
jgi:hypothetical protein